jgi:methanol metabolism-related c-type cytochrome
MCAIDDRAASERQGDNAFPGSGWMLVRPRFWLGIVVIGWTAGALALSTPAGAQNEEEEKFYSVVDGKVDQGTYNGWRRYHASCHTCHGPDGLGSSYAPNLVDAPMSYEDFTEVVINGRENVSTSQQSVMPAFGTVMDVATYIDDIYAYLQARADGVLGRGRPQRQ